MKTIGSPKRFWSVATVRWLLSIVLVAVAVVLGRLLDYYWQSTPFTSLFILAILISAWVGGFGPGLLAVTLSVLAFDYYFLPPIFSLAVEWSAMPRLIFFAVSALMVALLAASQRSRTESLRRTRDDLAATVQELKTLNEALHTENAERRRAEGALRQNETHLAEAQRLSKTGSWVWNVKTRENVFWSREHYRIFGFDPDTDSGQYAVARERIHPADLRAFDENLDRAIQEQSDFEIHYRIVLPGGEVKHVRSLGHPVVNETGELIEFIGTTMDVTERKRAEAALRRSENYLTEAQRLSHTGSWARSLATGELTYCSEECYRVLGFEPHDGLPQFEAFLRRVHPNDQAKVREIAETARLEKAEYEVDYRIVHPGDQIRDIQAVGHPVFNSSGDLVEFVGTVIDVTERKQAEAGLREQASLLNLTHDCIFVRDMNNVITYWNHGAEEFYGWTAAETVGKVTTHQLLQTVFPVPLDEINQELLRTGRWEGELMHIRADGIQVAVASRWSLRRDEHGRPVAILETNNDITERKRAEAALRQAQADLAHMTRLTTMGELTASIAHEVNQPLTAVVNNANASISLLPTGAPNLEEVRVALAEIIDDANRASDVITRVRQLAKRAPVEKSLLDLSDVVQEV
ncbi:MAG TPA: PAS domain-containing protein, partial [Verrucomicrobiae bacterium]|nr:PAS domain-containing protein [Verrucomicrobiae bacterium]